MDIFTQKFVVKPDFEILLASASAIGDIIRHAVTLDILFQSMDYNEKQFNI